MARPPSDSPLLTGLVLAGRYTLHEVIGRGSAGEVYRAVQHPLERVVAVKVLRSDLEAPTRQVFEQRFLREAALAGRLRHPNVVTVHDCGEQGGILFVVMELLAGRTLQRALNKGPLPPEEAARIASAVARGLRHAHQAGLVHRDVKPANIMLVPDDDGIEQPKLMDFGLVRSVEAADMGLTGVGHYMGTPAFMAPEQARSPLVDHRADIYALGCVLYQMLTGSLPFQATDALSMALQHQTDAVPTMASRGVRVPVALEAIARRAMEKNPASRYDDAGKMADALDAWLAQVDAADQRQVSAYRARKPAPERSGGWMAAMVLLGTALALILGTLLVGLGGVGVAIGWWSTRQSEPVVVFQPPDPSLAVPVAPPDPVPAPVPVPDPAPEAAPAPKPSPKPRPAPTPAPAPAPEPAPPPRPAGTIEVDGVVFDQAHAARALQFLNTATPDALEQAGIYNRGVGLILTHRPFASLEAFGATSGIGVKTVEAVARATRSP